MFTNEPMPVQDLIGPLLVVLAAPSLVSGQVTATKEVPIASTLCRFVHCPSSSSTQHQEYDLIILGASAGPEAII